MNIITRKKEIMEVNEKLDEATKATRMFNKNSVTLGGVEYVKTNEKPKKGDYVVFNKALSQIPEDVLHPIIYVDDESLPWIEFWIIMDNLEYTTFTKKSPTRKDVINKATE